jgi:hypothetical protein
MSRDTRKCTSVILIITIITILYAPSLIVGKNFRLVGSSLIQGNNTDYQNSQPLVILGLPHAYLTYGDDGSLDLGFKGAIINKTLVENPDFSFPLINEGLNLQKGMSFHIPTTYFIGNKSVEVENNVTVIPILKQDGHGNFDKHDLGNESIIIPNRRNVDGSDDFILNKHVKAGQSYILTLDKIFKNGIVSIYQTRLSVN